MVRYLIPRLAESVVTFVLVTIVVFVGVRALPGDPARALAGEEGDPAAVAAVRHSFGLDQPLPVQYVKYVGNALHGNLGTSSRTGLPVASSIGHAIPVTVQLAVFAVTIAALIGVGAGMIAAVRRRGPANWAANSVALIGLSVPSFWLGLMGILVFAIAYRSCRRPGSSRCSTTPLRASGTCSCRRSCSAPGWPRSSCGRPARR